LVASREGAANCYFVQIALPATQGSCILHFARPNLFDIRLIYKEFFKNIDWHAVCFPSISILDSATRDAAMKTFPNLSTLSLAASIGAFASTSLTALALTLSDLPAEQQPLNRQPHPAVVVDVSGNWLRASQESRQGLYLSLPAQRWIF
jgi:hypothetical protein